MKRHPARITSIYDKTEKRFYVLAPLTGQLYVFIRPIRTAHRRLEKILSVPELDQIYVRSFTIDGVTCTLFPAISRFCAPAKRPEDPGTFPGSCRNLRHDPADTHPGLVLHHRFHRPYRQSGLCDNPARAGFKRSSSGSWEDIYDNFVGGGTPYYISSFDGHYYLTEHRIPRHSVWQFDVIDNALTDHPRPVLGLIDRF